MKIIMQFICVLIVPAYVFAGGNREIVKWSGLIYDLPNTHTTDHNHSLLFEESKSQKIYDVVNSSEIEKLHHATNKKYEVELEGYLTPQFLFWGGNLVVTNFNILKDLGVVALNTPPARQSRDRK